MFLQWKLKTYTVQMLVNNIWFFCAPTKECLEHKSAPSPYHRSPFNSRWWWSYSFKSCVNWRYTKHTFIFRCCAQQTIDFYAKADNNEKFIHTHHPHQARLSWDKSSQCTLSNWKKVKHQLQRQHRRHQQQNWFLFYCVRTVRNYYMYIVLLFARLVVNQLLLMIGFNFFPFQFCFSSYRCVLVWTKRAQVFLFHKLFFLYRLSFTFHKYKSNQNNTNVAVSSVFLFYFIDFSCLLSRAIDFFSPFFFNTIGCIHSCLSLVVLGHFKLWQVRFFLNWCYCDRRLMCFTIWFE